MARKIVAYIKCIQPKAKVQFSHLSAQILNYCSLSLHLTLSSKVYWLAPRRWPIRFTFFSSCRQPRNHLDDHNYQRTWLH